MVRGPGARNTPCAFTNEERLTRFSMHQCCSKIRRFAQVIAIFIYYLLSRYLQFVPYTAVVFLLGSLIGYATANHPTNAVDKSALLWMGIDANVLLGVFLPGLIFLDAVTINVHLFFQSFWQLIVFAFPMVLGEFVIHLLD